MGKALIRKQLLALRRQLDATTHSQLSQQVQQQLLRSDCFVQAKTIALYSPINNEVATEKIFAAAQRRDKKIYYPRVNGDELEFFEVFAAADLSPGCFGVAEPVAGEGISVDTLDLIVVPGIAFDLRGHRLGYGRGYYDRQLEKTSVKTVTVGLSFEAQVLTLLPAEVHDRPLDFIATESRLIPCRSSLAGSS
ncbi:5-formyltetrahydrofolate cyclo-ligase [uncultured Desulfuromusa sp.]|uniref:5-formyltetrahydrofolate cyclo-ligase n=1 Tax=uncultured Desulfuromusa sp. TaxID=219183 RepID=UPI002AA7A1BD|nr:5-formyltetrahydrofolate cyclo-ligase [uncultured Desulfuromusa sp.]